MKRINFEDGQLVTPGYVKEDGTIEEAVYEGETPLSSLMMNKLQDNIEEAIDEQILHKYILEVTSEITAGETITIPCKYKVGSDVLDVYLNGQKLLLSSDDAGANGYYREVGEVDSISNQIKLTTDWGISEKSVAEGRIFEFIVKGEYE